MAVLTDNTYDDMLNMVDYFMTDRSGDGETMLEKLNVEKKRRLKCSARVLLTVEAALDKVFKDIETVIGVSSLISPGASHCFNAPKNSAWYLGLIALAKLLFHIVRKALAFMWSTLISSRRKLRPTQHSPS